jgi:hypothetical protein
MFTMVCKVCKKKIARKLRQHQKSQDNQYICIHKPLTSKIEGMFLVILKKKKWFDAIYTIVVVF